MEPVFLDLDQSPQTFLVSGPPESGKTTALNTILQGINKLQAPKEILVISRIQEITDGMDLIRDEDKFEWVDQGAGGIIR